jgi:hypothetical protein
MNRYYVIAARTMILKAVSMSWLTVVSASKLDMFMTSYGQPPLLDVP